jgi:hypothetical protein
MCDPRRLTILQASTASYKDSFIFFSFIPEDQNAGITKKNVCI